LAVPAVAMPIVYQWTVEPDPIHGAIKKDRSLHTPSSPDVSMSMRLADAGVELAPAPGDSRIPEMIAIVHAGIAARVDLANRVPTTPSGLIAYLDYGLAESEKLSGEDEVFFYDGEEETLDFVRSLALSIRGMPALAVQKGDE
jgi:hypothetical protein